MSSRVRTAALLAFACVAIGCAGAPTIARPATAPHAGAAPSQPPVEPRRVGSPYAYEWYIRAEIWRAKGELGPALEAYQLALASSDEDPHLLARYATALDESGDPARAEAVLRDAFGQDPQSESAWLARAAIAERHAQTGRAIEAYERAEAAAPSSPRPVLALAALLSKQGSNERARAVLARYEARVLPGASGAQRARLRDAVLRADARAAYVEGRAIRNPRPADVEVLGQAVELLLAQGHCGLALDLLDAIARRPEQARVKLRGLIACAQFGAVESLLRETDPELLGGALEVARAYLAIGRFEDAEEIAAGFLAGHPEDLAAIAILARAELGAGNFVEAAELFARIPAEASEGLEARAGLVRALEAGGLEKIANFVRAR
jgi:tetratricopeptide (TPR) repeat protein